MPEYWRHPEAIVSTDRLEAELGDPGLRIYDCTTYLRFEAGADRPYQIESGRSDWTAAHIPGSVHLDLQADFSDPEAPTSFMRLSPQETANAFAAAGVSEGSRVVLYSRGNPIWATRFWWMLRWIGFDAAAVLDGGFDKWAAEGRPVDAEPAAYTAGALTARPRPDLFVDKADMLSAIGDEGVCTLNALFAELHTGERALYGRPGHIPGSTNVPAATLIDPATKAFLSPDAAASAFRAAGAVPGRRVLNYCGGGVAATLDAFLQHQLGFADIAVYDASMSEWAADDTLPIETG